MRVLTTFTILALLATGIAYGACTVDSDCPNGEECKESKSGTFKCYRIERDPPRSKDNGSKKKEWVCDADLCGGWTMCPGVIPIPCQKCCYVVR